MTAQSTVAVPRTHGRDALRARIHRTAMALFLERGFEQTTLADIAAAIPVSTRTVHRYFPSKEAIALASAREAAETFADAVLARPRGEPPLAAARHAVVSALRLLAEYGGDESLRTSLELATRTPDLAAKLIGVRREGARRLAAGIAVRLGRPHDDLLAVAAATAALWPVAAARRHWNAHPGQETLRDAVARAFAVADRAFGAEPFHGPPPADLTPQAGAEIRALGLRERKAVRLRAQFVRSAVRLFRERGYTRVTVDDIVRSVDVSPRTFFRYFASKEHVLLDGPFERYAPLREMVIARPADEGPVTAVRNALRALVAAYYGPDSPLDFDFIQLVCTDPALRVTNARIRAYAAERLTLGLCARLGTAADALEPNVVADIVQWMVVEGIDRWIADGGRRYVAGDVDAALRALDAVFHAPGT